MQNQEQEVFKKYGYKHVSRAVDDAKHKMNLVRSGKMHPLLTKSAKETEKIGGWYPSDQTVVAARLGVGKSAYILNILDDFMNPLINPYYKDKIIILYDSWEMPDWRNVLRMISKQESIPAKALLDYNKQLTEERYQRALAVADQFKGLPLYMSTYPMTVTRWEESKKQIYGQFTDKYFVNVFDHIRLALKSDESKEEERITNLMLAGMRLKNNFNMFNFFLSQMNRNIETNVTRRDMGTYTPVVSDIFGGDSIGQCADVIIGLHRPGMYGVEKFDGIPTGIDISDPNSTDNLLIECILKQREGWTGNLIMKHNLAINKIEDYDMNTINDRKVISSVPIDW